MEKTQLKEKVQKHVDSLFLTLSQNLDVQVSEDVQNRLTNRLSQEAFDVLLAQKKQGLIDATEQMFTELQNDLGMTFREQTKSNLLEILLAEAGVSFEDNPTEIKPKDVSSDKSEIHSEEKSEAETNAPQVADETVQEADKVATHKKPGRPWTEECHDPEIIRKVNETFAQYYAEDFDKEQYSRDMYIWNIFDPNSLRKELLCKDFERFWGIKLDASIYLRWKTLGDIYDSVLYCLKEKEDIQELETETNASQVADETVQKADKVVTNKNSGKPWTEECRDPEIINNVNGVIARYYEKGEDDDREDYSRDMDAWNIYGLNRQSRDLFRKEIEELFDIKLGKSIYSFWKTLGDIYDSVFYYLKQKEDKQEQVVETKVPQAADETVQKADKAATHKNSGKPWTEECHDPEIIRKVNVTFACYYKGDLDKKQYSRDMKVEHAFASNSSKRESFGRNIEGMFSIRFGKSVYSFWETLGDIYDSVLYCLKQKSDEQQISGKIDKQEVYGVKKLWGDYKVDPSDSSPKIRKIVDTVNQTLIDKLGIEQGMITRESHLKDDLEADSLDKVELVMECEKTFNFSISDEVASKIQTVGDAYDCLYYYLKE